MSRLTICWTPTPVNCDERSFHFPEDRPLLFQKKFLVRVKNLPARQRTNSSLSLKPIHRFVKGLRSTFLCVTFRGLRNLRDLNIFDFSSIFTGSTVFGSANGSGGMMGRHPTTRRFTSEFSQLDRVPANTFRLSFPIDVPTSLEQPLRHARKTF